MQILELLAQPKPIFSFEFFPPETDAGLDTLLQRAVELARLRPSFVSVTYGAGGSTRERTRKVVVRLHKELGLATAAHLTCLGHSRQELFKILDHYRLAGVQNIVALRGDPSSETERFEAHAEGFHYASEMVEYIRSEFGEAFGIAVAGYPEGHPETPNRITDLENLKRKVEAGADVIVTQLFFDNRDFYDFRERCELAGIRVPIVAGLMPMLSRRGIMRMAGLCGSRIPAKLLRRLERAGTDDRQVAKVGIDWTTQQSRDLLDNHVRGIHFYTLNRSSATIEIYRRLGATDSESLGELAEP